MTAEEQMEKAAIAAKKLNETIKKLKQNDINMILKYVRESNDNLDKVYNYIQSTRGCEPISVTTEVEEGYGLKFGDTAYIIIGYIQGLQKKLNDKG